MQRVLVMLLLSLWLLFSFPTTGSAFNPAVTGSSTVRQGFYGVSGSSSSLSSSSSSSLSAISQNKDCVIVGGGPIGLATALTLARAPHYYNVTVLEATSDLTSVYDPTKSYLYNVNPRGLQWFLNPTIAPISAYQGLQQMGYTPGIGSMGTFYAVPAQPTQPVPNARQITMMKPVQPRSYPTKYPSNALSSPPSPLPSYWIPRHQLNEILYECCNEHNIAKENCSGSSTTTTIKVLTGKAVCNLYPSNEDPNLVTVQCQDGDMYTGALIVAADGINSVVRSSLAGLLPSVTPTKSNPPPKSWLQSNQKSFRVRKFKSPATGLKFKALQFKPNLMIPNRTSDNLEDQGNGDSFKYFTPDSTDIISVRGMNTGFRDRLSLGFLPMKDPNMIRLGNTIAPYDHEIWTLQNGTEAKRWFQRTFPRLQWDDCLVHDKEWDRYVQTRATTFPYCQYSPGSAVASPNGLCGIVMVGDACHAFPPDVGQGVNAGLQDVVALDRAMGSVDIVRGIDENNIDASTHKQGVNLGAALLAYQKNRGQEHAALIRIARFGGPYQYRQPWLRHRIGAMLWTMNFLFRTVVNKLSFGFIPSAIITSASDPSLTYRQVMRRADNTAFGFQFILLTFILRKILLRWSTLSQILKVSVPTEICAAFLALIILKGILPLNDSLENFLRRERYVGTVSSL